MKTMFAGLCLMLACAVGCVPPGKTAESPDRATARAVVLTLAEAVKDADQLCATFATSTKNVDVAKACADAYDVARPSLISAEAGIDAWDSASKGQLACLAVDAVVSLSAFSKIFDLNKIAIPVVIVDAVKLAEQMKSICHP